MLPNTYACIGGACDRDVRIYRATPPPDNWPTYEINCFLLLDHLVLHPCVHIHGDRRAAADLFADSGTRSFNCCTDPLTRIWAIICLKT